MKNGAVAKSDAFDVTDNTLVCGVMAVNWNGNNWANACDFRGGDFANAQVGSNDCGAKCVDTSGCTNFAWTSYNGGTCWMKNSGASKDAAVYTGDQSMICGVVSGGGGSGGGGGGGVGTVLQNVYTTRHVNNGGDACALPARQYAVTKPFALGDRPELGYLKFKPDLCGHVLTINCGHGDLDIIITNSNYGGGMDLYSQSTWYLLFYILIQIIDLLLLSSKDQLRLMNVSQNRPVATSNAPPGQVWCSVQLTNKNPLTGGSNQCFYKPGTGTNNPWYRNIGLLNTNEKIVAGATVGGQAGVHRGDNIYYAFDLVSFTIFDGDTTTKARPLKHIFFLLINRSSF